MSSKRGILIDVAKLNVFEVEFDGLDDMYRLIDCDMVECVSLNRNTDLWVDEEGLLKNDGKGFFFYAGREEPLKGNGLITGGVDEDGETLPCTMSLEEAASKVIFAVDL